MNKKIMLMVIITIALILTGCPNGNSNNDIFTVTIGILTNGNITANPTSGVEGTEIILTVKPETGYSLKAGTLRYGTTSIDETTRKFFLPASNVTVTAEFESTLNPAQQILGIWLCDDFEQDRWFRFESDGTGAFDNDGTFISPVTFNYTYNGVVITITNSSGPLAIPNEEYPTIMANDGLSFTITGDGEIQIYYKQNGTIGNSIVGYWEWVDDKNDDFYLNLEILVNNTGVLAGTRPDDHGDYSEFSIIITYFEIVDNNLIFTFEGIPDPMECDFELSQDGSTLTVIGLAWSEGDNHIPITFTRNNNP